MKVKVFSFKASEFNIPKNGGGFCLDSNSVEKEINSFCKNKNIIDIKVDIVNAANHNNGGCNGVYIVYNILYNDK